MKKIFSIWENQSKNGNIYYTGKLGEVELIGFRVKEKKSPKAPDIEFFVKEDKPKKDETKNYTKNIDVNDMFAEVPITENLLD